MYIEILVNIYIYMYYIYVCMYNLKLRTLALGQVGPGSKSALGPSGPWAQMGPESKWELSPSAERAQVGPGPHGPETRAGPGTSRP